LKLGCEIFPASAQRRCETQKVLQGKAIMKITKLVILIVMIALALFLVLPNLSWAADDGATIYKTKCAMCHGADFTGKPAAEIPSLVGARLQESL
jgi:cytochrome c553